MEKENEKKLDDATRVKVMSPGMLVARRFSGTDWQLSALSLFS